LQQTLLRQGHKRFGKPGKAVVNAIHDLKRLDVASWAALLDFA
jgi:hypothetical protein